MGKTDGITKSEKDYIKNHFLEMTISEIALALGRSYEAVRNHCVAMHLHRIHKWKAEEDAVLFEMWGKYPAGYIAEQLKTEVNSVYNRVRRLRRNGMWYDDRIKNLEVK